jgi:catechol 2,3-dioxygenase-like lactoylglutathione lyase family enzyme
VPIRNGDLYSQPGARVSRRTWRSPLYAEWSARGAEFLTPPKQHETEIRCYIRDPDGHLIEVGQTTLPGGWHQFLTP